MTPAKLKKLQELFNGTVDVVPKGWYTAKQVCDMTGKKRSTVSTMLNVQVNSKKVKTKTFIVKTKTGSRSTPHYFFNI